MSQSIKNLVQQLQEYYKSSGRKPEGLYDLLLSFIFWQWASEQEDAKDRKTGISYQQVMQTGVSPKEVMTALRSWEKFVPLVPKALLLPDKDSIDHIPNREWQQICTTWLAYHNSNRHHDTLSVMLNYLETLVAGPRSDERYLTPAALTHILAQYLEGGKGTALYDPYPRTGNLLAAAADRINAVKSIESPAPAARLAHKFMVIRFLLLNRKLDTLPGSHKPETNADSSFDYILSNPPFGTSPAHHVLPHTSDPWTAIAQSSRRLDVAFLCHILSRLSEKGKAAVVVPTIYLSSSNTVVSRLVREIVDQDLLDMVIKLPADLFATTKVATVVLCFNKARTKGQDVYLINAAESIGKKGKQVTLDKDKLQEWISQVKDGTAGDDIVKISAQVIAQHEYSLQPEQYQPASDVNAEPTQTAAQLWQECEQLRQKLAQAHHRIQQFYDRGSSQIKTR